MFVYLAHPIDQVHRRPSDLARMIHTVQSRLTYQGHSMFRPSRAYTVAPLAVEGGTAPDADALCVIDDINRYALLRSDGVVALLPPEAATLGVPAEIELALSANLPVWIVTTPHLARTSVQIGSWERQGATILHYDIERSTLIGRPEFKAPAEVQYGSEQRLLVRGEVANLQPGKYAGDAGIDLAISRDAILHGGQYEMIETGVHVAIPEGYFGLITGRSSTWAKHRCRVVQAVIDSGYRGELMVGIENASSVSIKFEKGMRLAQMILLPTFGGPIVEVDELPAHERALNGYGSSGQ